MRSDLLKHLAAQICIFMSRVAYFKLLFKRLKLSRRFIFYVLCEDAL